MINFNVVCSFSSWHEKFSKDSLNSTIIDIPNEVLEYLDLDAFVLPKEAITGSINNPEWTDGAIVDSQEKSDVSRALVILFYYCIYCRFNFLNKQIFAG